MRHESIFVVYDSCQATAEEIADKLGAEPVSVQVLNSRMMESARNFVLCITLDGDGQIPIPWLNVWQMFSKKNNQGKGVAMLVFNGENTKGNWVVENFCKDLRKSGAHMIGEVFYADSDQWSRDCWIAGISPNL